MKRKSIKVWQLIVFMALPLAVGFISSMLTRNAMVSFSEMNKPMLAPPAWLFPVAWTVLYLMMGAASYLVFISDADRRLKCISLAIYGGQLIFNFFWSIIFFSFKEYMFAFVWLVVLWIMVLMMMLLYLKISKAAAYMTIPYLAWLTFAGYLNLSIYMLN